jgi:Asp-tRNA(Asn)/Glu-tRNA(Gln) amidotransferase C subunit
LSFVKRWEVTLVPEEKPLTREAFLYLAEAAGLDTSSPHMDELYPYVQSVLASMQPLNEIDVAGAEPDMAFIPPQA